MIYQKESDFIEKYHFEEYYECFELIGIKQTKIHYNNFVKFKLEFVKFSESLNKPLPENLPEPLNYIKFGEGLNNSILIT